MGVGSQMAKQIGPRVHRLAPGLTSNVVHEALGRAITGIGPLAPARVAADKQLIEQLGDAERAIHEVIENNVRMAGVQGFVTNLGGLVTATVLIPANVAGLAVLQCRMVAGIAHLRGYDVDDLRVRNAILAVVLGEDAVNAAVRKGRLPARPLLIATALSFDPALDKILAAEVANELVARAAGKRMVSVVARRVPVVGGVVGAGADGIATWRIGRYAGRELAPRLRR